ncbi:acyloxyacyl hydrolase [Geobacter pickeringii]|uniref:Lipid A 3-O-deacylase n=1 Tax=Geobacter pickeringii TaxID=345632 RepID=A0A0B5B669_9BACT|nr:acyloxyacyl hydrolase [Geobacter pickeringii]AJE02037.1 lipid A 3-O-deacylase [Geobacter pickeringii]
MRRAAPLLLIMVLLGSSVAGAVDSAVVRSSPGEFALLAGYGITHRGFGATRTQVQTADAILRYGHFLSDEHGAGWYRGRHELFVELPLHLTVDPRVRTMTGGYLLGSWKFTSSDAVAPYLFAGGGVLYNDLGLATQGTRLNFSYQGGVGLQWFLRTGTALGIEYRYHHVSNAGTADPNEPLNSSKILFGISFYR